MKEHLRILLVEDDDFDAKKIQQDFQKVSGTGVTIEWRTTLEEGVAAARDDHFDAMVLDLGLPDRSGKETLVYARVAVPHMPILVLTGKSDRSLALWSVQHGAQEYLVKGEITPDTLDRSLRYALERHGMLARIEQYAREAREAQSRIQRGLLGVRERLAALDISDAGVRETLDEIRSDVDALCAPIDIFME
jgi:DNA-binding response OmpR family regulator